MLHFPHKKVKASLLQWVRPFAQDTRGVALIEFAVIAPVLALLLIGSLEVTNYMLTRQKVQSSAMQTLGVVNQSQTSPTRETLDKLYGLFPEMMGSQHIANHRIIMTRIVRPVGVNCKPVALWQYPQGGSDIAPQVGGIADTNAINLAPGDGVVAIEIKGWYELFLDTALSYDLMRQQNISTINVVQYAHTRTAEFNKDPNTGNIVTAPCITR